MADVKLFKIADLDLTPTEDGPTVPVVNAGYSKELGAGIGVFENCSVPWMVTYDEVLFIKEGDFTLRVGEKAFHAGPGDILWIPKNTALIYEAKGRVTFFYAVHPVGLSPSTSQTNLYPTTPPS
jgi:ethanolamine utilization protein EutQ (cupin superfamily)